jgi:acetyltransferase-like isoleucine patch superfamily enzyme
MNPFILRLVAVGESAMHRAAIRYAGLGVVARLRLRGLHVGDACGFLGMPVVTRHPESQIMIGDGVRMISKTFATALGVSHPCVLRTLAAGATLRIGSRTGMSGGAICAAREVVIGSDCLIGADVVIADTDFHPLAPSHRRDSAAAYRAARPVVIGDNVFLGTRVTVLKGVEIGENTVVGAGSVVTGTLPANVIAGGNPCRIIRQLSAIGSTHA